MITGNMAAGLLVEKIQLLRNRKQDSLLRSNEKNIVKIVCASLHAVHKSKAMENILIDMLHGTIF